MNPLSIIGLAGGFLGKLFGADPEKEYEEKKRKAIAAFTAAKTKSLDRITRLITGQTSSNMAQASQAGAERAAAMGRPDSAETLIQPQVSKVATAGADSLGRATTDINNSYDQQIANLEASGLDRPVSPNAGDFIAEAGKGVMQFGALQSYLDAKGGVQPTPATPTNITETVPNLPAPEQNGIVPALQEPDMLSFQSPKLGFNKRKPKPTDMGFFSVPNFTDARRGG